MIIVEGSDKLGKTTLCRQLCQQNKLSYEAFKESPPEWDWFWDFEARASLNVVWDRGWLSEICYQEITSRDKRMSDNHVVMVKQLLQLYAAVNVVVVADRSLLERRLKDLPDDKFEAATVLTANKWFKDNHLKHQRTDVLIYCDLRKPYPSGHDVADIIALHKRRVEVIQSIVGEDLCLTNRKDLNLNAVRYASAKPFVG